MSELASPATVLLIGFPNTGKSTLFNLLTGGARKVSNYSGISVDSAVGELESNRADQKIIEIVDLPGIYNLNPSSLDEGVTIGALLNLDNRRPYQLVALVLDFQRLEASMSLALAVKELVGDKVLLVVNKDDEKTLTIEKRKELEQRVGLNVLSLSALKADASLIDEALRGQNLDNDVDISGELSVTKEALEFLPHWQKSDHLKIAKSSDEVTSIIRSYQSKAREALDSLVHNKNWKVAGTRKIDSIVLNPWLGGVIFVAVFYLIFHALYSWAGPVMDLIDEGVGLLGGLVSGLLPEGILNSLVVDGIIGGVGGVVIFLPQIMFLFFLLSLLEQSGYISRAAIVTDRVMSFFGLNGKAFLPYMSGFACSIPGIMAARTIPNQKERMATIMTLPLITCSARLPVYILLVGAFVPERKIFGFFNSQALSFFFLYFLGSFAALVIAKILRLNFFKGESSNFIIDLPLYQAPNFLVALKQSWFKGRMFLRKAGTVILGLSILIWFLSVFPKPMDELLIGKPDNEIASITLEQSMLGTMGRTIEPVLEPIGMDWKMGVGLLVSLGARELFVSTLGTLYALGDVDEESATLRSRLKNDINLKTGKPTFSLAVAWSILIFFVFGLQCTSTLAIVKKETGGWKIPLIMLGYMTALAYSGSFLAYRLLS